jgi:hypothetical protein
MSRPIVTPHLTDAKSEHVDSVPGMAHFAHTGPEGTTCSQCRFWDRPKHIPGGKAAALLAFQCLKARELAGLLHHKGRRLPAVPAATRACRYFETRHRGD